jgi:hypothetical protein
MENTQQRRYGLTSTTEAAINGVLQAYFSEVYDLVALTGLIVHQAPRRPAAQRLAAILSSPT